MIEDTREAVKGDAPSPCAWPSMSCMGPPASRDDGEAQAIVTLLAEAPCRLGCAAYDEAARRTWCSTSRMAAWILSLVPAEHRRQGEVRALGVRGAHGLHVPAIADRGGRGRGEVAWPQHRGRLRVKDGHELGVVE